MQVNVKAFAHLRDTLGFNESTLELSPGATATDVWRSLTGEQQIPRHVLVAMNYEYAAASDTLDEGDEIAFFPPVTGGC